MNIRKMCLRNTDANMLMPRNTNVVTTKLSFYFETYPNLTDRLNSTTGGG